MSDLRELHSGSYEHWGKKYRSARSAKDAALDRLASHLRGGAA